jgi:probable F420-dependent oxidoreductase
MKLAFAMPHQLRIKAMTQPWELQVTGPDQLRLAQWAEQLGYGMVCVPEHYVMPAEHRDLSGPFYLNGAVGMAAYAGATERIRVNSCISILPLQNPIATAKQLATMDWLSGGRVTITWAVGWVEREFALMGVDFYKRGEIAEEYTRAIIELWTSPDPRFEGKYVSFKDILFEPRCVQTPHVPIWFGGDADAVLRRTARHATGWFPFLTKPEQLAERIDFIRSQADYNGKLADVFYGFSTTRMGEGHVPIDDPKARPGQTKQEIIDRLSWFKELGVTWSGIPIPQCSGIEEYFDYTQWVAEEIMPVMA